MLKVLTIENVAVIEYAEINFEKGFNVLTGETGAGKSILIDSINAVLGARVSKDLVRNSSNFAYISAYFEDINSAACDKLKELGISFENNSVLLERKITADGKSNARINGKITVAAVIKELSEFLIDIHGQHDNQKIMKSDSHYKFVDGYARNDDIYNKYLECYKRFCDLKNQFDELIASDEKNEETSERLRFEIEEITAADISIGEMDNIKQKRIALANSEKIFEYLQSAVSLFSDENTETGITVLAGEADKSVCSAAQLYANLKPLSERVASLRADAEDIREELQSAVEDINFDWEQKNEIDERFTLLSEIMRKYGQSEQAVLDYLENAQNELRMIENYSDAIDKLENELKDAQSELIESGKAFTESRRKAADDMSSRIADELNFLDMPGVKFDISVSEGKYTKHGCDNVEFLISTNPGEPLKAMAKIASGGELSRIMLALKNVLVSGDDTDTMIFDEIDTGISGNAANKVGSKLKDISRGSQVICVTHLAQIAAKADAHYLIKKTSDVQKTYTTVTQLDFNGRKLEIARIMGGNITEQNLKSAEEMLTEA